MESPPISFLLLETHILGAAKEAVTAGSSAALPVVVRMLPPPLEASYISGSVEVPRIENRVVMVVGVER
jgi:hypothetical protein